MFGGLSVTKDGASCGGAAAQRKTLALLALLAAAGDKGMSRDKLIAYLWPDSDDAHARNLLSQACYALRRDLGAPELFLGSVELRLNSAVIGSDVQAFEQALRCGEEDRAVDVYVGPFLDGFYVSEAGEFERWVEAQRERLADQYTQALESLGRRAMARGDHRGSAVWWRRLVEAHRLNADAALGLATALEAAGEQAEALRSVQAHAAYVRQELGADPASAVVALIRRLQQPAADDQPGDSVPGTLPASLLERVRQADLLSLTAVGAVAITLAALATAGVIGRRSGAADPEPVAPANRKMLAVLPFENRGAATDEYFADGLSEAIATRLGSIQRLGVIAWPSASQYKETTKSPQDIGRELGVQYILQGSVRWERGPGLSRIRVSPTLIRVSDATQLWADQYDTTLTGVFAVQTTLATRVAGALDLALADAERHLLEARPAANLQAYDAYLRARELLDREFDVGNVRKALDLYERAVALDSTFALAYAWLSVSYVWLYTSYVERSPDQLTRAKAALNRAMRLDPNLPESHSAMGFLYDNVLGDNDGALREYTRARSLRPNDPWLPVLIAGVYEEMGRWNDALPYRRAGATLDPRNLGILLVTGASLSFQHQFTAATYYYDRALALQPRSIDAQLGKALVYISQTGDLPGGQHLLPETLGPVTDGVPILALSDVATLLDAERRARLLALTPAALEGDTAVLALAKGLALRVSGRGLESRAQFDSARIVLERRVHQEPDDGYYAALLGLAYAGLGRAVNAIREGERAVRLHPVSQDAQYGPLRLGNLARIYVLVNEPDKAIQQLEAVLSRPGPLSAGWLRADPFWDPLRASPRFQRLASLSN